MKWKVGRSAVNVVDSDYRIDWNKAAPSKIAQKVKDFLHVNLPYDSWFEEYRIPKTLLRVDYLSFSLKLAIEVSGRQHFQFVDHFHKDRANFLSSVKRDEQKRNILESNEFTICELDDEDVKNLSKELFLDKFGVVL
jgi:hypothetical protein